MSKQALYRHFDCAGQLLYVGISLCPFTRTRQHGMAADWFDDVVRVEIERFETRSQAQAAEWRAIKNEHPMHNQTFNRGARFMGEAIIVVDSNLERLPGPVVMCIDLPRKGNGRRELAIQREAKVRKRMDERAVLTSSSSPRR